MKQTAKPFPPATSFSSLAANSIAFAANSGLCNQGCKSYRYIYQNTYQVKTLSANTNWRKHHNQLKEKHSKHHQDFAELTE